MTPLSHRELTPINTFPPFQILRILPSYGLQKCLDYFTTGIDMLINMPSLQSVLVSALVFSAITNATPSEERRAPGVCGSGTYGEVVPVLMQYPVAQAFCTANFPVACTSRANLLMRAPSPTPVIPPTGKTTIPVDRQASAWSKVRAQPASVIKIVCACIESPTVSYGPDRTSVVM